VNDTYGHLVGDEYIRLSAQAVESALPENGVAFRTGGDEFIAFLPGRTIEQTEEVVAEMQRQQKLLALDECKISISFGTAVIESPEDKVLDDIAFADRIMYAQKAEHHSNRSDGGDFL
jgi:diguanylate cyclase (GGDEF)-like protein